MSNTPVTFYWPKLSDPSQYDGVNPDADWSLFKNARAQWIPQTYVRLRQTGHAVRIANRPPQSGIAVVFAGDMARFLAACETRENMVIVCAQADQRLPEVSFADVVVQHNGLRTDGRRRFFIPNWPQPGLVRRDPRRKTTVRTVCYKGNVENLRGDFLSPAWRDFLERRGLQFVVDADVGEDPRFRDVGAHIKVGSKGRWHDYADADVVLAVRPHQRDLHRHKPALKLVNAWRAGVPALLGPEHAYREVRRSPFDYLEVSSLHEAMDAIDRLCADSGLYQRMVDNGMQRAVDFSVEKLGAQWERLLFSTLCNWEPPRFAQLLNPITVPVRRVGRSIKQRIAPSAL